ncbi:hypothetical protein [Microbacterium sp. VKM Ac-2923]|uniref:hypothetical protein n=1 Tax=Microbacterium sp. VKM Ac-2923 TaxID=2929476 RepID=UPI001FB2BCB4|nr:hypothetical protein [Microbacterium sp. VKM Ac-2923]MCJ1708634.1 hypothetical protein [Microbacterium sp. VKM Ac-2923]
MHHPPPSHRRTLAALTVIAALLGGLGLAPAAQAADRGTGFGTWAPLSRTGWHGSMRVGDVHTYCIHPGLPVATDTTTDHGVSFDVNGLTPQQLVSINHLVTTYGQTGDPVQAAGVGWAVKAIVDRDTTLHSWGYTGDSFPEAIDYIMRRASPENSAAVQERAVHYLAEAESIAVPRVGGALTLTTRDDDPTRGTVIADVDPSATGTLHLENAVFADTGRGDRADVKAGQSYDIIAPVSSSDDGRPYSVRVSGTFSVRSAAIRYFSTPGQQESAGPADPTTFTLSAVDASPRLVRFSPRIETTARIEDGRFIDRVTVSTVDGVWPRHADGSFVVITATADVYRTGAYPAESAEIPSNLDPVMQLDLRTDPGTGAGAYEVVSERLPGPGVYTAVWRVDRADQDADALAHLPGDYLWQERFASPAQTEQLAPTPPPSDPRPSATPPPATTAPPAPAPSVPAAPAALAMTGMSAASLGGVGGAAAAVIGLGVIAWSVARRRFTPRI